MVRHARLSFDDREDPRLSREVSERMEDDGWSLARIEERDRRRRKRGTRPRRHRRERQDE